MPSPSTTSPWSFTRMRSDARMWLKLMPKGFTQKWSRCSGSRAVMWPATPSSKPNLPKSRNPAASRCLRCRRSSSTVVELRQVREHHRQPWWKPPSAWAFQRTQVTPEGGEAFELHDPAVVVHEQAGAPALGDHRTSLGRPGDERGFGEHLGAPGVTGHDRDRRQPARRRSPGPRVDEVVQGLAVALSRRGAAGCWSRSRPRGARASRCSRWRAGRRPRPPSRGVPAPRRPRGGRRRDSRARRGRRRDELGRDEVGGVALADAAEVERDAGRERARAHHARSSSIASHPGAGAGGRVGAGPRAFVATASKSRSYPAATTAGSTVGS